MVSALFGRNKEAEVRALQRPVVAAAEEALRSAQKVADKGRIFSRAEAASSEEDTCAAA